MVLCFKASFTLSKLDAYWQSVSFVGMTCRSEGKNKQLVSCLVICQLFALILNITPHCSGSNIISCLIHSIVPCKVFAISAFVTSKNLWLTTSGFLYSIWQVHTTFVNGIMLPSMTFQIFTFGAFWLWALPKVTASFNSL